MHARKVTRVRATDNGRIRRFALLLGAVTILRSSLPAFADGEAIYAMTCAMCHTDGSGSEMAPPLKGSPMLAGDPVEVLRVVLHGRMGVTSPTALMPPADWLTDAEAAAVVAYVRAAYAGQPGAVPVELAARARAMPPQ